MHVRIKELDEVVGTTNLGCCWLLLLTTHNIKQPPTAAYYTYKARMRDIRIIRGTELSLPHATLPPNRSAAPTTRRNGSGKWSAATAIRQFDIPATSLMRKLLLLFSGFALGDYKKYQFSRNKRTLEPEQPVLHVLGQPR